MKMEQLKIGAMDQTPRPTRVDFPPVVPVGLDAYRQWDRWHIQQIGVRAYMDSTRDRTGGNKSACGSHYYYQERPDFSVPLHVEGKGVLYFHRANCWHGSPWHYEVDGIDQVVSETATADPKFWQENYRWAESPPACTFEPRGLLAPPLAYTWTTTRGADLIWLPVMFERSFRIGYGRTRYGTGYFIYKQYVDGIPLSTGIQTMDWQTPVDFADVNILDRAGEDIAPAEGIDGTLARRGTLDLAGSTPAPFLTLAGAFLVRAIDFSIPAESAVDFGEVRLQVWWDGREEPSIDAPVALFFGAGTLYNPDGREYLVRSLPMVVRFTGGRAILSCYFPMPFFTGARFGLVNHTGNRINDLRWAVRCQPLTDPVNHVGYFHATYRDHQLPVPGRDLILLDTTAAEGGGDWTGQFVGTSFIFSNRGTLQTLEGIPRFYFDDARHPQGYGTGTEEWGGGGDYWGNRNMTLPLAGHPAGQGFQMRKEKHEPLQPCLALVNSAYRFLLADSMPFGKNARIQLEHGGENETTEHYRTVTYWYGLPGASVIRTDELRIGDPASEREHGYLSPEASEPASVISRFEAGPDHIDHDPTKAEVFPEHAELERHTKGESAFELRILPGNLGVMLRRTFDQLYPNQRAQVYVDRDGSWEYVGIWFSPGSNTCVHTYPKGEDDPPENQAITCNRRFRESEFLIGRTYTVGQDRIRVKCVHLPDERCLWPDRPFPEKSAWSEIGYQAYCFVMPGV